jgi:hypothetical protein
MLERELPALWSLLGHADGLNATLAHAAESCVANAQVCLPRAGALPPGVRARVANERKVLQCMSRALCDTHAYAFTGPRRGWAGSAHSFLVAPVWSCCSPVVHPENLQLTP